MFHFQSKIIKSKIRKADDGSTLYPFVISTNDIDSVADKMDVQGAEIDVLMGATKLLHTIQYIFLEVSFVKCNKDAPLFDEVFMYLYKQGYKIIDVCEPTYIDNVLVQTNFLFARDI